MQFKTVWSRWEENARITPVKDAIIHWIAGEEPFCWSFKDLLKTANSFSIQLKKLGIIQNQVCAKIIRHIRFFYPLYMWIVGTGATPAVLAYPNPRLHPEKFREGLEGMGRRSGLDWILTERALEGVLQPLLTRSTIRGLHFPFEGTDYLEAVGSGAQRGAAYSMHDSDPLLLQHSSGTTGLQKPVLLS